MSLAQVILDPNAGKVELETSTFLRMHADGGTQLICYLHVLADALTPANGQKPHLPDEATPSSYQPLKARQRLGSVAPGSRAPALHDGPRRPERLVAQRGDGFL